MASTYSDLKIELIGTGDQVGTWGATTNTNLGTAIEDAITGSADVTFSSADVTLTLINSNSAQTARNLRLVCTGTSGGARQLILGSGCQINKLYLIQNDLADAVTVKNTTGTGVTIAAGKKQFVFNNGTNVVAATDSTVNLTSDVTGVLPVANGGTGAATLASGALLVGSGTSAVNTLTGNSVGQIPQWNGSVWSLGSIPGGASIPSGTSMLFVQTTAPVGFTKSTAHNNKALRVVSGTASSGGSTSFTSAFTSQTPSGSVSGTVFDTTLSTSQMPNHAHTPDLGGNQAFIGLRFETGNVAFQVGTISQNILNFATTSYVGGNGPHNHFFSGSFSGNSLNLNVQYVDVIIAIAN